MVQQQEGAVETELCCHWTGLLVPPTAHRLRGTGAMMRSGSLGPSRCPPGSWESEPWCDQIGLLVHLPWPTGPGNQSHAAMGLDPT